MPGALEGLKILDFTALYPGPLATQWLADNGADVLRVEAPDRPDLLRWMPPLDAGDKGAAWRAVNRNKRSIALNLKAPGAVDVVRKLIAEYDILVEQFRPGVLDRLGLGCASLRALQPGLIWCAISSYGQTGPWRDRPGHDIDFLATAGVAHHTGRPGQGPTPNGALQGDFGGGTFGAVAGILAAVVHRQRTGQGQLVDVSMADGALWMNMLSVSAALAAQHDAGPATEPLNGGGVYDYYATADGRYLAMGALEPKFWSQFCAAVGAPELELEPGGSPAEIASLKAKVAAILAQRTLTQWTAVFAHVECCVEPVLTPTEAVQHPQFAARHMIVAVPDETGELHRQVASPVQFSTTPAAYARTAVETGHDTTAVLAAAGFDPAAIAALRDAGAIS